MEYDEVCVCDAVFVCERKVKEGHKKRMQGFACLQPLFYLIVSVLRSA